MADLKVKLETLVLWGLIKLEEPLDYEFIKDELEIRFKVYASNREITSSLEEVYYQMKYDSKLREVY